MALMTVPHHTVTFSCLLFHILHSPCQHFSLEESKPHSVHPSPLWAACVRERGAAESKGAFLRIPKGANEQWMWGKCSRRCPADMQMRKLAQIVFLMLMPPNKGTIRTQRADEGYVPLGTEKFSVLSPDPPDTHEACHTPAAAQGCHATSRDWGATPLQASLSVHTFFKQAVLPL